MSPPTLTLEQRIRRLEDLESIRTLKSKYHLHVNDTDFEKVGALFTEDAYLHLGYLMPNGDPVIGKTNINVLFQGMKTNNGQSQIKQFLHSHMIEITEENAANGSGMLYACYGVGEKSYVVSGKYIETYERVGIAWLFKRMTLDLYFTVPLEVGWAGHKRHFLVNSGEVIPNYKDLFPNPAVKSAQPPK
jgi:SnoaL-like domain